MNGWEAYTLYTAIKQHFSAPSYDYFKYNGRINSNIEKFKVRNDVYFFEKLGKKHGSELRDFLIANFLLNPNVYVRELLQDEAEEIYTEWKKRNQSLRYVFSSDLNSLSSNFNENFKVENGQHPKLLKLFLQSEICIESFIILCDCTRCVAYFDKYLGDDVIWPSVRFRCKKYQSFLHYDVSVFKQILLDKYTKNT